NNGSIIPDVQSYSGIGLACAYGSGCGIPIDISAHLLKNPTKRDHDSSAHSHRLRAVEYHWISVPRPFKFFRKNNHRCSQSDGHSRGSKTGLSHFSLLRKQGSSSRTPLLHTYLDLRRERACSGTWDCGPTQRALLRIPAVVAGREEVPDVPDRAV